MAQTAMTVRVDDNVKKQFDALCEQFGMSVNAAVNVFINAVVRTRSIPFKISAEEDLTRKRALDAFLSADRSDRPEMTLEEINEEIRAARRERKERLAKEGRI
jgi:addiction module RelB/DinJ family antitoxin